MAGIYIHIPFCKQRCHYCDFYTTTQLSLKAPLVDAVCKELELRKDWLNHQPVHTIYFGGGTPSLLSEEELSKIFETIYRLFPVENSAEITLEANPDDLTEAQITMLAKSRVNRISMGVQSFHNHDLGMMNRRHNANQAVVAVKKCQDAGFSNMSIDLIYGLPELSNEDWEENLEITAGLNIQHLSAYHLTYEEGTVFELRRKKGDLKPLEEENSIRQFEILLDWARENQFDHYEISNFAKEGFVSRHNSSYWRQEPYLGIGPSAHSYNLETRSWNAANLKGYLTGIENKDPALEFELLSETDKFNDFLITSLRTAKGIDLTKASEYSDAFANQIKAKAASFLDTGQLKVSNNYMHLTNEGMFISDAILTELLILPTEEK